MNIFLGIWAIICGLEVIIFRKRLAAKATRKKDPRLHRRDYEIGWRKIYFLCGVMGIILGFLIMFNIIHVNY